jgi:hypothetical protein
MHNCKSTVITNYSVKFKLVLLHLWIVTLLIVDNDQMDNTGKETHSKISDGHDEPLLKKTKHNENCTS